MICNLRTNHISPQYHIIFDENFATVPSTQDPTLTLGAATDLSTSRDHYLDDWNPDVDGSLPSLDVSFLSDDERSLLDDDSVSWIADDVTQIIPPLDPVGKNAPRDLSPHQ